MAVSKPQLWLRRIGAGVIIVLGFALIALTFWVQEGALGRSESGFWMRAVKSVVSFENRFHDMRTQRFLKKGEYSPNLVILEISDASLQKIGRWPWSRTVHAQYLEHLRAYGAKVFAFDGLFPELEGDVADDAFIQSINRFVEVPGNAVIMGYGLTTEPRNQLQPVPVGLLTSALNALPAPPTDVARFVSKNNFMNEKLLNSNATFGFIDAYSDPDGVFRRAQVINDIDKTFFPSLSLAAYAAFHGTSDQRKIQVEPAAGGGEGFDLNILSEKGPRRFRLTTSGDVRVRFFGGREAFQHVSVEKVLEDVNPAANEEMKKIFAGKMVLTGSTAYGAHDFRYTPVDPMMPGMYLHANVMHALDQGYVYKDERDAIFYSIVLFLLGIFGVLFLARFEDPIRESMGALIIIGLIYCADYYYFTPRGYIISLFFILNSVLALYGWFTFLNLLHEAQEKKRISDTFSRYVAPKVVKEMLSHPEKLKVGGEKKNITMLFSDVRSFTSISEKLTPDQLALLLNIYMGRMTDILFDSGGTLDKYIGDAIIGLWGAPIDMPDHAFAGVNGAKQMLDALPEVNAIFREKRLPEISVGIGLNTGDVSVGNMGSDRIFQYTALGDNMNLASRLEGLTKHYAVGCLISEFTYTELGERKTDFLLRPIDRVQVKGKSKPVRIFELIGSHSVLGRDKALLERYTEAYGLLYREHKFKEAAEAFGALAKDFPDDKPTRNHAEKAELYYLTPPENLDIETTVFTEK